MRNMSGPKQTAYMIHPVKPVKHKVFKNQQYDPIDPGVLDGRYQAMVIKEGKNKTYINDPKSQVDTSVEQHKINILCCIFKRISVLLMKLAEKQFNANYYQIERCGN